MEERKTIVDRVRGSAPSTEERILQHERLTLLRAAVEQLRHTEPGLHAVLEAHLDGESIARMAARLGLRAGTACTRLRLARDAVRATLHRWAAEEARQAAGAGRCLPPAGRRLRAAPLVTAPPPLECRSDRTPGRSTSAGRTRCP